jgi:hypothetical protein
LLDAEQRNSDMKIIKRIALAILVLTVIGLIFRGWLYRHMVTYKSAGQRMTYLTGEKLADYIEASIDNKKHLNVDEVIVYGLRITSQQLNFMGNKNDNDPNKLLYSKTAHCVGYTSFFVTTCNYLLKKHNLSNTWTAKPQIGQLYFLGVNIHQYFSTPFFKDHDFATIENKTTGEVLAIDPTVNDYLFIDFVTYTKMTRQDEHKK